MIKKILVPVFPFFLVGHKKIFFIRKPVVNQLQAEMHVAPGIHLNNSIVRSKED